MISSQRSKHLSPEDGVIKFSCKQLSQRLPDQSFIQDLNSWRTRLHEAKLIGVTRESIGYGNVSCRLDGDIFVISASATGHIPVLRTEEYATVSSFNLEENCLEYHGKLKASSESLSHATIYKHNPLAHFILHVHSKEIWEGYLNTLPTTDPSIPYGTPEMASALGEISTQLGSGKPQAVVMGGHQDGVIAFGEDLDDTGNYLLSLLDKI